MVQDRTQWTLRSAVLALMGCLSISLSAHAAGQQADSASSRVAGLLAREGFVGEVVVADRERVRGLSSRAERSPVGAGAGHR